MIFDLSINLLHSQFVDLVSQQMYEELKWWWTNEALDRDIAVSL